MTNEIPFHLTRQGHIYFERTLPDLVRQLGRLNDVLERLVERLPAPPDTQTTDVPGEAGR